MDESGKRIDLNSELGMSRRDLIRRGAIVGGTLLWVAPAIQSMAPKAFAQEAGPGSARCGACYCWSGSKTSPSKDRGFDGQVGDGGGMDSTTDCHDFCTQTNAYSGGGGATGGPYTASEYCSGVTSCDTNTKIETGANGAFCDV